MFYKEIIEKHIKYFDTSLIALILSIVTVPTLWNISHGDTLWVLACTLIWGIGVFIIFHPSVKLLFPFLLTKIGTFALTFILALVTILLNSIVISTLLPLEDTEIVINRVSNISISSMSLFVIFYIATATTTVLNMHIDINHILDKQKKLIQHLFTLSEYYIEIIFISVLPITLLFWTDITYSFRVVLGMLSIGIGMSMFILKMEIKKLQQKILLSTLSIISILVIDGAVIHLFGMNSLPTNSIIETRDKDKHLFQLSSSKQSKDIIIYQILLSIPQIGLEIGHKVASIPNREITVEATKSQYTIHDQYNDKVLLTLDR